MGVVILIICLGIVIAAGIYLYRQEMGDVTFVEQELESQKPIIRHEIRVEIDLSYEEALALIRRSLEKSPNDALPKSKSSDEGDEQPQLKLVVNDIKRDVGVIQADLYADDILIAQIGMRLQWLAQKITQVTITSKASEPAQNENQGMAVYYINALAHDIRFGSHQITALTEKTDQLKDEFSAVRKANNRIE